jgi:hypothetical protein
MVLRPGQHLESHDAIMTCDDGITVVRATYPFGTFFEWTDRDGSFTATIPRSTMVVVAAPDAEKVDVEVLEVQGAAFYTSDRHVVSRAATVEARAIQDPGLVDALRQYVVAVLGSMEWDPLTPDRALGPWDMIWTREGGRAEIEILQFGPRADPHESTTVLDAWGRETPRRRFRSHTFLVMDPTVYANAQVIRVIGDVVIARHQAQVREFVSKHPGMSAFFGSVSPEETLRWRESLKEAELR